MSKALILTVVTVAICVGCKRLGYEPGQPVPDDGMTAAQYNWWLVCSALWPVAMPLIRLIPGAGPIVGPIADALWALSATKKQKEADKA